MRTAAVLDVHDMAVGRRVLVAAHSERRAQRTRQRVVEAARAAALPDAAGHVRARTELPGTPARRGLHPALVRQHPLATEADLARHFLERRLRRVQVARHEALAV